jgi:GMP synthase (glutamine-hydrolysing)
MKILYVLHADFELPGMIEVWANEKGYSQTFWRPFAGEKLKRGDFDLLILMGGPQSPLEIDNDPYLLDEIALAKKAIAARIPVLGFCLGAQIIGEALGAKTERSPHKEVGVFPIALTEDGKKDPLLKGAHARFDVVHWHNDMPGLTKDAKILAYSEGCPRQIVRYSPLAYGFQCHLEAMKSNIEAMIHHCPDDLKPGKYVQAREEFLKANFSEINRTMIQILNNLVKDGVSYNTIAKAQA